MGWDCFHNEKGELEVEIKLRFHKNEDKSISYTFQ